MSELHKRQDTVGAIAWDSEANLAAGVSRFVLECIIYGSVADGLQRRPVVETFWPCWRSCRLRSRLLGPAECRWPCSDRRSLQYVRCAISAVPWIPDLKDVLGSGEYIIREMLARRICEDLMESPEADTHEVLHRRLEQFQSKGYLTCAAHMFTKGTERSRAWGEPDPIAGVLLLVKEADDNGIVHRKCIL